ncbi:amino acid adenylation domain-containing protein [Gordonia alkaliphila]|uniref:amino acid adenylation domain-containing protein n=1 Tax=Gordonia alkaliphila TaxID=1053547 RepID=UPI001FF1CF39|nr:amino acid adenylation domain-containing protein [Gordonia alkaliphila]MCK0438393.1 amino acid adenylation domain-containing protein [Gordonia alkaliphila]
MVRFGDRCADLFDESTAQWLADRFVALLGELTAEPAAAVGDVALLDAGDRAAALAVATGPVIDVPAGSVADAVAVQVAATPDAAALVFEGREVSYAEFGARVATLARELIAAGVGPDVAVGVCIDRSVELLVAIHAITAAGGQYVPVDIAAPVERARVMLDTAGAQVVLVAAGTAPEPVAGLESRVIEVDGAAEVDLSVAAVTDAERLAPLHGDSALYTLFTSGSTGTPKGVTVSHEAVLNRLVWMRDDYGLAADARFLQKTPYTFDVSVWELFLPLLIGAPLVIARPDGHRDPQYLASVIAEEQVSVVHFVPSMLSVFLDVVGDCVAALTSLTEVFTSGEALAPAIAQELLTVLPSTELHNLYGPTEAAVDVTAVQVLPGDELVTIGRAVANTTALVLDDRLQPVPDGVPGELYLGGVQIARGYAAAPALTAERFVADPFGEPGSRLYRTGDLVKRQAGGDLEYLGRTDFQVKLRGQRIELGEIEAVIAGAPGVVHAAATVAQASTGGEFLVGYVSPASVDLDSVKEHVAAVLPEYMRPSVWTLLDEVTLNSAGKLDRRALPEPDLSSTQVEYVAPEGEAEAALAAVFAGVLGVDRVSVTESFFDAGGNSLAAMRLVARAGEALGVELSIRDLFDAPTVRDLVAASVGKEVALPPVTAAAPRPDRIPLSFAQQRMWFINRLEPELATYNIPFALEVSGDLDVDALYRAVLDVIERHEILRTTFPVADGDPYQLVHAAGSREAEPDWAAVDDEAALRQAAMTGFDVTTRPPLRIRLWERSPGEWLFVAVLHHIVADGESMGPLVGDVVAAYAARAEGRAPEFEPLPVQFADYALWQRRELGDPSDPASVVGRQLEVWERDLAGLPGLVEIPADRPRPQVASHRGATYTTEIPHAIGDRIEELARQRGVTPFMVVHAALAVLISRLSATAEIAILTPIAGRGQRELDPLIGMFVNTLVLRTDINSSMSFDALLSEVRGTDLEAFANADVPFESLVERLNPVRSQAFTPLSQVMLTAGPGSRDAEPSAGDIDGLHIRPATSGVTPAQVDLTFDVRFIADGPWALSVVYATDLFDETSITTLSRRFIAVVDELTENPYSAVASPRLLDEAETEQITAWSTGGDGPHGVHTVPALVDSWPNGDG